MLSALLCVLGAKLLLGVIIWMLRLILRLNGWQTKSPA